MSYPVLHGSLGAPAEADGGSCGLGAVGQQGQVPRDHDLLTQLAVQRELSVKAVPFQVQDENSVERTDTKTLFIP